MVATRLNEITSKGLDWYNQSTDAAVVNRPTPGESASESSGPSSVNGTGNRWDYASNSINHAAEQAYSTLSGVVSSFYTECAAAPPPPPQPTATVSNQETAPETRQSFTANTNKATFMAIRKYPHLMSWMLKNPYSSVRGRHHQPSSMSAVRSLLTLVPFDKNQAIYSHQRMDPESCLVPTDALDDAIQPPEPQGISIGDTTIETRARSTTETPDFVGIKKSSRSVVKQQHSHEIPLDVLSNNNKSASSAETASQLAEGAVRALRDIALEEGMELHGALRHWTDRWENPFLSWLEAGPWVWFSNEGYSHQEVGRKVSQIQAVLARRCSTIGELQQHLLRAGWQRGVAQWGVLGEGGQWAQVTGCDGAMERDLSPLPDTTASIRDNAYLRGLSSDFDQSALNLPEVSNNDNLRSPGMQPTISNLGEHVKGHDNEKETKYYGHGNVFVNNTADGTIFADDSALAEWSIDAILLIRSQLYRAGNGKVELPFADNWTEYDKSPSTGEDSIFSSALLDKDEARTLPRWADLRTQQVEDGGGQGIDAPRKKVVISNLPLLAAEVSELLNSMEEIMEVQRERRLNKLKPPQWARRNWYITTMTVPAVGYFLIKVFRDGYGRMLAKFIVEQVGSFVKEHVTDPLASIYVELFKGRESISDREARMVAIFTLKKMIRSWLDETYPNMPEAERERRAEIMDISLLEEKKEQNMKSLYEINSVIRMSFIEMQFIKKELLNALVAIDDMVQSNEINMNLAAVTPAVLLIYLAQRGVKFLLYALLKIGKSRAETYSSFRQIILDIERLLVMRHNPPSSPQPISWGAKPERSQESVVSKNTGADTLSADDTGMLMLHIHECRTILWLDRSRFSAATLRNVAEDLAELAGERGAVSVQQQLLIVTRMGRTYPFLKVLSTGTPFQLTRVHSQVV